MAVQDVARIEERLDRAKAGATLISDEMGGVLFQNMAEVMEFAKLMSLADIAIPVHLRGNPGACLRVVTQALEWRMSPFAVAEQSYKVGDKIGYMAQLVHAVIEQRAPITGRLRHRFEGEGDDRVCIVWATVKGDSDPLEYKSPPFGKILPKNSPLWKTKPDLQQYYNTSRDFCRVYFPDVLLGVYSEDELRESHTGPDKAKDVTPKPDIAKRLKKTSGARGFDAEHVERETSGEARSPAGHGAAGLTEPVTGTGRPQEPESGPLPLTPDAVASVVSPPPEAGQAVVTPPAQTIPGQSGVSGHSCDPGVEGDPDELGFYVMNRIDRGSAAGAREEAAGGVEARATEVATSPSGPPSIFRRYWGRLNEQATGPKEVAYVHKAFFTRHIWPEDEVEKTKFERLRTIRLNVLAGVYSRQEGEEKAREVIGS